MAKKDGAKKILIVLTGGTICSFANKNGEQESDTKKAQTLIVQNFRNGDSEYSSESCVKFETKSPLDILSENMTIRHWNTLLGRMKKYDFSQYDGVIVLHGTDTLAYTASLLSILLAGIGKPVFLISSQLPLYEEAANGNENFKVAVEHIIKGIKPNVYVAYRNDKKNTSAMYIHYGAHLLQCPNHSNNFYSEDMKRIKKGGFFKGREAKSDEALLYKCGKLENCVLKIVPYVGIDYSRFSLKGVKAVLHHTYHSSTMSVNPYHPKPQRDEELSIDFTKDSIMRLKKRCDGVSPKVELYIEPCNEDDTYLYETTGIVLRSKVGTSWRTTSEMAYVKLLIGCAMGYSGKALQAFVNTQINSEFIR
ncbi:MAG: asparaginase [Ruminococcus sp.]|nr:asparaginase [Ruminococcus sp.]